MESTNFSIAAISLSHLNLSHLCKMFAALVGSFGYYPDIKAPEEINRVNNEDDRNPTLGLRPNRQKARVRRLYQFGPSTRDTADL